jgi:hypothetical protein
MMLPMTTPSARRVFSWEQRKAAETPPTSRSRKGLMPIQDRTDFQAPCDPNAHLARNSSVYTGRSDMKAILGAAALLVAMSGSVIAGAVATGDQINAAISGNTVQGSMVAAGAYTEFYGADGVIKGKDYSGKWRVNGDTMCFQYGQDPEACWQVKLDGNQVTWVKDGKDDGTGTIVKGNPNNF